MEICPAEFSRDIDFLGILVIFDKVVVAIKIKILIAIVKLIAVIKF